MADTNRLRTLSGLLYWVALVLSVLLPIIVLIFGEITPKTLAALRPEIIA